MVNVTIYGIHGSYGYLHGILDAHEVGQIGNYENDGSEK